VLAALAALPAHAADDAETLAPVLVTANPLGLDQPLAPATVLEGRTLSLKRGSTLGATLDGEPGVSTTGYGPWVARPIIRGMDGDRIRILQNGVGIVDASALSYDHALPQSPLSAERIEVVRGPAALLYGGNAVGGVVNTLDNRIPSEPITTPQGRVELDYASANRAREVAADFAAGTERFALHVDAFHQDSGLLRIPGYARSARLRAVDGVDQPQDQLPNSDGRADGAGVGGSLFWDNGYLGLSYGIYDANYGSVAEPSVRLRMHQDQLKLAGEVRDLAGPIQSVKFNLGYTDYQHMEIDDGTVGTQFKNRGYEGRIEARHAPLGPLQGVIGAQFANTRFAALGDEALVPETQTRTAALFALESWQASNNWLLQLGGRLEHTETSPAPATDSRFAGSSARSFAAGSASLGAQYALTPALKIVANGGYTERAPTFYELYANGPHAATGQYLVGNADAQKEQVLSFDLALRYGERHDQASVGVFYNRFRNYLAELNTGRYRNDAGDVVDRDEPDALPEARYSSVAAEFYGVEFSGGTRIYDAGSRFFDLSLRGDYIRANNRDTGEPLPRIAPLRMTLGASYGDGNWLGGLDVTHAWAQDRVPANDLPSDAYTTVGLNVSYQFRLQQVQWLAYLRGDNLGNAEIRQASSVLRDIAPEAGRSVKVGLKAAF
jgi:iron complex outermembrane receptor protein